MCPPARTEHLFTSMKVKPDPRRGRRARLRLLVCRRPYLGLINNSCLFSRFVRLCLYIYPLKKTYFRIGRVHRTPGDGSGGSSDIIFVALYIVISVHVTNEEHVNLIYTRVIFIYAKQSYARIMCVLMEIVDFLLLATFDTICEIKKNKSGFDYYSAVRNHNNNTTSRITTCRAQMCFGRIVRPTRLTTNLKNVHFPFVF